MRTILIPTDFSIASLSLLKVALNEHSGESLGIVFVCGYRVSDSISELLFHSPSKILAKLESSDFREACEMLGNRPGSRISSIRRTLFTGKTSAAFNRFVATNEIDEIVVPVRQLLSENDRCFDLTPFLEGAPAGKTYVSWEARPVMPENEMLAALFAL
jgi:hypothetical protein